MGNCSLLNGTVESEGIRGMRGINTLSPAYCPVQIVASIKLGQSRVTCQLCSVAQFRSVDVSQKHNRRTDF